MWYWTCGADVVSYVLCRVVVKMSMNYLHFYTQRFSTFWLYYWYRQSSSHEMCLVLLNCYWENKTDNAWSGSRLCWIGGSGFGVQTAGVVSPPTGHGQPSVSIRKLHLIISNLLQHDFIFPELELALGQCEKLAEIKIYLKITTYTGSDASKYKKVA